MSRKTESDVTRLADLRRTFCACQQAPLFDYGNANAWIEATAESRSRNGAQARRQS